MNDLWFVTIWMENLKGKVISTTFTEKDLISCSRIITTFVEKRGYETVKFEIEKGVALSVEDN